MPSALLRGCDRPVTSWCPHKALLAKHWWNSTKSPLNVRADFFNTKNSANMDRINFLSRSLKNLITVAVLLANSESGWTSVSFTRGVECTLDFKGTCRTLVPEIGTWSPVTPTGPFSTSPSERRLQCLRHLQHVLLLRLRPGHPARGPWRQLSINRNGQMESSYNFHEFM